MSFCIETFSRLLRTSWFGREIKYFPCINSTQIYLQENFKSFPLGTITIADIQDNGKGRGGNSWTSPNGCLMFSFLTKVNDGCLLPFFQYLVSLAMIKAIKYYPEYKQIFEKHNLPINMKWPNDIYSKENKIAGVICNSEYYLKEFHIITGVGINISNEKPTTCINDIIKESLIDNITFSKEQVLAEFCNTFEIMYNEFIQKGFSPFEKDYIEHWLHTNQKVSIIEDNKSIPVWILGLTKNGYLKAKDKNGIIYELHPDGNSFDIFNGLIRKKIQSSV